MTGVGRGSIALVTCAAYAQLSDDDRLLLPALSEAGFEPVARLWDDPAERWAGHAAVVVRSCWDYHHRPREFHAWLDRLSAEGARVFNPVPLLRWNADKRYLRDLADAIPPLLKSVHDLEERLLFPDFDRHAGSCFAAMTIERLKAEHRCDRLAAEELSLTLKAVADGRCGLSPDTVARMLAGFQESLRRHVFSEKMILESLLAAKDDERKIFG